jgi:antitoxin VapB
VTKEGSNEKTVRLFRSGRNQAVRIPKEWEFEGDEIVLRREADGRLAVLPKPQTVLAERRGTASALLAWLRTQEPVPDFPGDPGDEGLRA